MIKVMIKEAAKRRGLKNAYQFGQSIGVKRMVASRIWNNDQLPKLKTLDRICNAWGCGIEDLIVYKRDPKKPHQEKPDSNGHTSSLKRKRSSGIKHSPTVKATKSRVPK